MAAPTDGGRVKIKVIDFGEYALALLVAHNGATEIVNPGMCDHRAADMLRDLADQLDALHPPHPCSPGAEPDPQHDRAEQPLREALSSLDADRKLWTDGTGHTWDLSVAWGNSAGLQWRWTGQLTTGGVPWMRTADGVDEQPLDVVRTVHGPIAPTAGDRS